MKSLGKYEIVEELGSGGMGTVYRARDTALEREVALKTINTERAADLELKERFYREARACARLQHPHIISVYDLGEWEGIAYIAMELLEGADLRRIITEKRFLRLETKLELMAQICEGLAAAHHSGIVHRDIKPSNIFVQRNGWAKILDFGVARVAASKLTRAGVVLGTPGYMAPEQLRRGACDNRSDLFSAAIVFFEFLVYAHPFPGPNVDRTIVREEPESLCAADPMLPASLEQVILRGLEKDPDARYGSASDFAAALRDVKQEIQEQAGSAGRKTKTAARQVLPELAESDQETQTMTVGACPPKLSSALASQPQASEPEQVRERPADLEGPNECEALLLNRSHGTTQGGSIMPDAPVDNSDTGAKKEGDQETQLASALDADLPIRNKLSKSGGR